MWVIKAHKGRNCFDLKVLLHTARGERCYSDLSTHQPHSKGQELVWISAGTVRLQSQAAAAASASTWGRIRKFSGCIPELLNWKLRTGPSNQCFGLLSWRFLVFDNHWLGHANFYTKCSLQCIMVQRFKQTDRYLLLTKRCRWVNRLPEWAPLCSYSGTQGDAGAAIFIMWLSRLSGGHPSQKRRAWRKGRGMYPWTGPEVGHVTCGHSPLARAQSRGPAGLQGRLWNVI